MTQVEEVKRMLGFVPIMIATIMLQHRLRPNVHRLRGAGERLQKAPSF